MATRTPWGTAQHSKRILRGLTFHITSGHGGYLVAKGFAEKYLSEAALKRGEKWGNYYAYEEDCAAAIVELEIPAARSSVTPEGEVRFVTVEGHLRALSHWSPDYLIERGVKPEPEGYSKWLLRQEDNRLRAERSPDLIVAAEAIDQETVRVTTANGAQHIVTMKSYQRREGLNLLSKCELIDGNVIQPVGA
jgi:hypothetical protein